MGVRGLLGLLGAVVALLICLRGIPSRIGHLTNRTFDSVATFGFALLQLGIFCVLWLRHIPLHADIPAYYLPQARLVLAGKVPYVDFPSSYQPLHAYLDAFALHLWNSEYSLLLVAIVCCVAGFPFWMYAMRRWLPEPETRCAALLVMMQPVLLWNIAADGRNDGILFLLLGVAAALVARKDFAAGMAATAPLVVVKFLPILLLPQFLAAARKRTLWLTGAAVLPVCVFGWVLYLGGDILIPLKAEGGIATAGGAPYAWTALTGIPVSTAVSNAILLVAYLVVLVWLVRAALRVRQDSDRMRVLFFGVLALMLVLLFFSKKSYPVYLIPVAFPLAACILHARRRGNRLAAWVYAVLLMLSMVQSSVWYSVMGMVSAPALHAAFIAGNGAAVMEMIPMVVPAICYLYLLVIALREPTSTCVVD